MERHADQIMRWLYDLGYTHCFLLAGGGSMHLVDAASKSMKCIPVVHEVTAVIAVEYFNATAEPNEKAFALVTTGPGLTNAITGIAGSWLESRSVLIIGGQVKKADLKSGGLRQRGIQEVDGVELVKTITKYATRIEDPIDELSFKEIANLADTPRQGPVFVEICIDASAAPVHSSGEMSTLTPQPNPSMIDPHKKEILETLLQKTQRPIILIGAGVSRENADRFITFARDYQLPVACTWGGIDRVSSEYEYYAGRPNTYGMRWANVFQQQADLMIAVGTSLGLQQTGFNWKEFLPVGRLVHVNIDKAELSKGHPRTDLTIEMNSDDFIEVLPGLISENLNRKYTQDWVNFLSQVKEEIPLLEDCHKVDINFVEPYRFINEISKIANSKDVISPCSSGGTYTAFNQVFEVKRGQKITSNKGLASMGYGLAGAIGSSLANRDKRVLHFEGDGGFAQNVQDLSTVRYHNLNIKMFIVSNKGYASIRTSQKSYFNGNYMGCDEETGLLMPKWKSIFDSFGIESYKVDAKNYFDQNFLNLFDSKRPVAFILEADPEQLYLPKVSSKINPDGSMSSAAIHDMSPKLPLEKMKKIYKYLPAELWGI
jgi:acetolactate synthase I/II/III large subunit